MALTIKNLKCGTVAVYPSSGDVVDTVATGKSVLVDNISFVNTSGSTVSLNVQFQNGSAAIPVADSVQVAANGRWMLESITLGAGQRISAWILSGSGLQFVSSGVEKDV